MCRYPFLIYGEAENSVDTRRLLVTDGKADVCLPHLQSALFAFSGHGASQEGVLTAALGALKLSMNVPIVRTTGMAGMEELVLIDYC